MTTPQVGPATVSAVAGWLGAAADTPAGAVEREHIAAVVPAVNALIAQWHSPDESGQWAPEIVHGAVMLAARITRRRNSPAGVESFNELGGATYVARYDSDLDRLLGLGGYRRLVVG